MFNTFIDTFFKLLHLFIIIGLCIYLFKTKFLNQIKQQMHDEKAFSSNLHKEKSEISKQVTNVKKELVNLQEHMENLSKKIEFYKSWHNNKKLIYIEQTKKIESAMEIKLEKQLYNYQHQKELKKNIENIIDDIKNELKMEFDDFRKSNDYINQVLSSIKG